MLQEAGQSPQPPAPSRPPPQLPKARLLKKIPIWIYGLIGVCALGITLLEGYPWLSIEEGELLDPANPMSEMFKVRNGGYLPVTNLDAICTTDFSLSGTVVNGNVTHIPSFADYLGHDGRITIPCFRAVSIRNLKFTSPITMQVEIVYNFYPTTYSRLRRSQKFSFLSVSDQTGGQHWQFK